MIKASTKKTILKGEGANQHTLYGSFTTEESIAHFAPITIKKDSVLKHEQPNGSFSGEHFGLQAEKGNWVQGKQVEFNPFSREVSQIWD